MEHCSHMSYRLNADGQSLGGMKGLGDRGTGAGTGARKINLTQSRGSEFTTHKKHGLHPLQQRSSSNTVATKYGSNACTHRHHTTGNTFVRILLQQQIGQLETANERFHEVHSNSRDHTTIAWRF